MAERVCVCVCVLVSSPFPPLSPFFVPKTGFVAEPRERDDETPIPPPSTVPASFLISTVCVILISPDLELAYPAKLSSLSSPLPWRPRRTAHRCKKGFNPGQHLEKKKQQRETTGRWAAKPSEIEGRRGNARKENNKSREINREGE